MVVEMEAKDPTADFQKRAIVDQVQTMFYLDTKINHSNHVLMLA